MVTLFASTNTTNTITKAVASLLVVTVTVGGVLAVLLRRANTRAKRQFDYFLRKTIAAPTAATKSNLWQQELRTAKRWPYGSTYSFPSHLVQQFPRDRSYH